MSTVWIFPAIGLLLYLAISIRYSRARRLERLRACWARPVVRTRNREALAANHASRVAATPGLRSLDERTWADLNLDEVFAAVDRTTSTLGQHALYHRIRSAPAGENIAAFEALIERFRTDRSTRERAQLALDRLQDPYGYDVWWLGRPNAVEGQWWYAIFPVLTAAAFISIAVLPMWPGMLFVMLAINLSSRFLIDRQIGAIAASIRQCAPLIATAASLRFIGGDAVAPITAALREDVPKLARLKSISNWANGNPLMLQVDAARGLLILGDLIGVLYEYLNLFLLLDATGVFLGLRDLNNHRGAVLRVTAAVGEIDAAISVASYRHEAIVWTRPRIQLAGTLVAVDLRHPLIADAVPNSIELRAGGGVLVTGSNMSGKSTFLRTVGVNAILAQTLNTCLAGDYAGPVFDVRSCIGRSDDLIAGKSYYLVEVESLLGLVQLSESDRPHLFLLDELFRGTNAVERVAAGHGVLHELLESDERRKSHVVLAATHDGDLVTLLSARYDCCHFGDSIGPAGLTFDHRLQPGASTTRTAIALLRQSGAPERLLRRVAATAAQLETSQ